MDPRTDAGGIKTPFIPPQDQPIIPFEVRVDSTGFHFQFPAGVEPQDQVISQQSPPPGDTTTPPPRHPIMEEMPQEQQQQPSSFTSEGFVAVGAGAGAGTGAGAGLPNKQTRLMAMGVHKTISKTSFLVNFLPTGTLLAFEMLLPSVSGNGKCNQVNTVLIGSILALCAITCCFFHFTDSYRDPREEQTIYYGFVTLKGLMYFKAGKGIDYINEDRFRACYTDLLHAVMSALVFVAIAFSDHRVTNCLFPGHEKDMDEIMQTFPLMVGIVCSGLFVIFPSTRLGVGCIPA